MERTKVKSSNLASIGYDNEKQILEIEFKHGSIYQCFDVPHDEYKSLMKAESHGKYFINKIRDVYSYIKIK
jgi:hypothetical protein